MVNGHRRSLWQILFHFFSVQNKHIILLQNNIHIFYLSIRTLSNYITYLFCYITAVGQDIQVPHTVAMTVSAFILMMLLVTTSIAGYTVPEADFLVQSDTDSGGDAATIITVPSPFSGTTTVKVSAVMESGSRRLKLSFPTTPNRLCPGVPLTHFISELRNVTMENTTITMEPALINGEMTSFPSEIYGGFRKVIGIVPT
ncbi:uncharacterized protein LOC106157818 isoform X4 [Lingula anatina]|uniref:Uncharacterized protein LOC106157818 isoform X4 n=1 Tax=Lingula anatina TaxID=7574 RepID=A0A1S3HVG8_LINAN|nr:uncharacterized protein LOC106157818 isoform X4 [Lingula anatina]|eukprot:XP_013389054.1 uncharacterized protein LOC106157818 isoform X4 [Lingula anatina]